MVLLLNSNNVDELVLAFYGLATIVAIVAIIFLIFRRQRLKKEETFEKRDN